MVGQTFRLRSVTRKPPAISGSWRLATTAISPRGVSWLIIFSLPVPPDSGQVPPRNSARRKLYGRKAMDDVQPDRGAPGRNV